jgi:hypothetical protein
MLASAPRCRAPAVPKRAADCAFPSYFAATNCVHAPSPAAERHKKFTPQLPSHQSLPGFPQPESLTPSGIIKEEPNSAQQPALSRPNGSCPALLDRTWRLSHHLAAGWGNEQMHRHQKCAHSSGSNPARGYIKPIRLRIEVRI